MEANDTMNTTILNLEQQTKLQLKGAKDPAFRQHLIAKPKAMMEKELGLSLPESLSIEVIETTENNLVLLVPPKPDDFTEGMTAEQWLKKHREELLVANEHPVVQGQARLFAKSWESDAFKKRLLRDPHETIAQEFSVILPEGLRITTREETIHHAIFILLVLSNVEELSIEELENFGGVTVTPAVVLPIAYVSMMTAMAGASLSAFATGSVTGIAASLTVANPAKW